MLLRHGSMRPRRPSETRGNDGLRYNGAVQVVDPRPVEVEELDEEDAAVRRHSTPDGESGSATRSDMVVMSSDGVTISHGTRPQESYELALSGIQRAPSRLLSKNCANIRKYGNRLFVRRRQRNAERIVIDDLERMRETLLVMDRQLTLLDSMTLNMRHNAEGAAMDMIKTYFYHMKHGLNPREVEYDRDVTKPFLEKMMAPDLKCQDFTGLENFFKQWEYVTKYHGQIKMTNDAMIPLPADSDFQGNDVYVIKTTGMTHCRISRDTLAHFFPHIMEDEELVQFLIGKYYSYGYTMILHVNCEGRVFQFESMIDLTSGLFQLLNDPLATLKLVDSSMWTKGGNLKGEVQEGQVEIDNGYLA